MSCSQFLKSIDNMGREFKFKIEGKTLTTPPGGIVTIGFWISFIVCLWYFGKDIILRENPNFLIKNEVLNNYPRAKLNIKNFFISVRLENSRGNLIDDPSIVTYNFEFKKFIRDKHKNWKRTVKEVSPVEKCSKKNIFQLDYHNFDEKHLSKYYCHKINKIVGGSFSQNEVEQISFNVERCNNKTSKVTCLSDADVRKRFGEVMYFDTMTRHDLVNPKNYSYPLERNYEYKENMIGLSERYVNIIYFKPAIIRSDINPLFNTLVEHEFLEYYKEKLEVVERLGSDKMYSLILMLSNRKTHYERVYIKIPAITARVGGFLNLFMIFINFFFNMYMDNKYNVYMIDKLYKLEVEEGAIQDNNRIGK